MTLTPETAVEFSFRLWVHPVDGDPPEIETWWQGLERTATGTRYVSEWASEALENEDFHPLFDLDGERHWQVVGKASLRGWFDYWGEYDEELSIISFEKAEVPETEVIHLNGEPL